MPAILNQEIRLKDGTVLQASDIKISSVVQWTCSSKRCAARHGKTTELVWDETEAEKSVLALPEGFFKLLKIAFDPLDQTQAADVCSVQCAKDWLTYDFIPPKLPRQILAEKEAKDAAQLSLPFPEPPLNPITAESDATGFVDSCGAAQFQDTGDPWVQ